MRDIQCVRAADGHERQMWQPTEIRRADWRWSGFRNISIQRQAIGESRRDVAMVKTDRIPAAWPLLMTDVVAARYFDLPTFTCLNYVRAGRIRTGLVIATMLAYRAERHDQLVGLIRNILGANAAGIAGSVRP